MAVEAFRCDYAKWAFRWSHDNFQLQVDIFRSVMRKHKDYNNDRPQFKVRALGGWGTVERYYTLECWGPICEYVPLLAGQHWLANLERVDFKAVARGVSIVGNYTTGMLLGLADTAPLVQTFNKPAKSKQGSTDGGGKGWAIGSHKSDLRISGYSKSQSPVGLEFQSTGTMLQRFKQNIVADMVRGDTFDALLSRLQAQVCAVAYARLSKKFKDANLIHELANYLPQDLSTEALQAMADASAADQENASTEAVQAQLLPE